MKKRWLIFAILLLIASGFLSPKAEAATDYGSSFFTNVSLQNQNGIPATNFKENSRVRVAYDFVITQPVTSGETMTLTIPNQLKLINFGEFPVDDAVGNTIANATIDPTTGTITLTFTDYVNTHTDLSGSLYYNATFNSKNIQTDQVNPILFPVKNTTETINAFIGKVNTGGGTGSPTIVFKQGRLDDKDNSILHWTVTLNNALTPIDNAIYTDTLGSGQNLIGSATIKYRDADKKVIKTNIQPITLDPDRNFELSIGTLNNESVVITYDTKITTKQKSYTNKATLSGDNLDPVSRNATVNDYSSGGQGSGTAPPVKEEPPFIPAEKQPIEKTVETDFGPLEVVKDSEQNGKIKVIYKVKSGDTLPGVAKKFDVTVSEIKDWNNLTSDTLQTGQKLQLTIEKTLLSKITVPPVQKVTSTTRVDGVVNDGKTGTLPHTGDTNPLIPFVTGLSLIALGFTFGRRN
ncbi:collagen binding domain-containing protein [Listeria cossartiae subsp. cayugensis]|uniref:Collagen binding domain-containing protein n=1 Tax=Listeria cossartiae subsp. cayugensis TaxID=2713505 RepID=A0ABU2IL31_9LIST|nr:collagen binding domain-containing protein [Listeria cossartiae]MDT0048897.1 collagen binding domain-containing protein [Listeria cossartiae subsp. cayugensis]MDT0065400.1 collagen binding domain-containing protein [Listeria cossartiae subsp. cayugensis]MDT0078996.1 collagen binding domain-containing protein [Listeria cossartiae subsp. cayugensis]MDT0081832.1 collagen binding domain-containing protein [Listeria cossartiae subsp. cayugensis]MDT0087633.1 collagen binding domain-containing pro